MHVLKFNNLAMTAIFGNVENNHLLILQVTQQRTPRILRVGACIASQSLNKCTNTTNSH